MEHARRVAHAFAGRDENLYGLAETELDQIAESVATLRAEFVWSRALIGDEKDPEQVANLTRIEGTISALAVEADLIEAIVNAVIDHAGAPPAPAT